MVRVCDMTKLGSSESMKACFDNAWALVTRGSPQVPSHSLIPTNHSKPPNKQDTNQSHDATPSEWQHANTQRPCGCHVGRVQYNTHLSNRSPGSAGCPGGSPRALWPTSPQIPTLCVQYSQWPPLFVSKCNRSPNSAHWATPTHLHFRSSLTNLNQPATPHRQASMPPTRPRCKN